MNELSLRSDTEPDPRLRELCYLHGLSIIPDTGGRYKCGPADSKGRFGWATLEDTPTHALAAALEKIEEMKERRW